MAVKDRALDVFQLLGRVDRKDHQIWDTLNEEQKKEFSPLVAMRWMAGTTSPFQLIMLNEIVNTTVFTLGEHKELLLKLLAICSDGQAKRYQWVPYKVAGSKRSKLAVNLVADHYHLTDDEAEDTLKLLSVEDLIEIAEDHGWQKDEIAALKKEMK